MNKTKASKPAGKPAGKRAPAATAKKPASRAAATTKVAASKKAQPKPAARTKPATKAAAAPKTKTAAKPKASSKNAAKKTVAAKTSAPKTSGGKSANAKQKPAAKSRATSKSGPATKAATKPAGTAAKAPVKSPRPRRSRNKSRPLPANFTLPEGYRPSEKEPFMNEKQQVYFRDKLVAWKEDIIRQTRETLEGLTMASVQHADVADRATSETDRALELRARDRQRKLVAKINAALARIEEGSYGYCEETGEPIGLRRLEARPIATLSLEAQERHERRERVFRDD